MAVARVAGRHHAIEHVDPARHRFDQVLRPADAHQVARPIFGQLRRGVVEHGVALGLGLAHREAADGIAVEADLAQAFGRTAAQVVVHAALDDAEQRRVVALVGDLRTRRPAQRQLHRPLDHALVDRLSVHGHRRAFVKDHHDVAAQHFLDMHRFLGPEEYLAAVGGRGEGHAFFGDLAPVRQREHLEAAGIGEDRLVPAGEAVQAAVGLDHLEAGPQEQVEGVAEDDLGAEFPDLVRQHALDRAVGADRHERRGLDGAAREADAAATGVAIGFQQIELHAAHCVNTCVPGRRARLPGTPARLMRTSMFDAPPRAIHGALSGVPGRRTLLIAVVSQLMPGPAQETATSHRHN